MSSTLLAVWAGATVALVVIALFRQRGDRTPNDKDLEASRLVYGFLLILGSLVLTLSVVVIVTTSFRPVRITVSDMLAIITSVTGVIGTLIAAFFGVQAAGAGRSQALSALASLQSQTNPSDSSYRLDPPVGAHAGGTRISVTGNGFTNASALNFGSTPADSFQFVNDGLVRGNAPAAPPGKDSVDVAVVFPGQGTPNRKVGTFYYYTINPQSGHAGTQLTIRGDGLATAKAVRFGSSAEVSAKYGSGMLVVDVPEKPNGAAAGDEVDVVVIYPVDTPTNRTTVGKFKYTA